MAGTAQDPLLIAVLGVTGAGKTTFVNKAAGSMLQVGHGMMSCTQDIAYASTWINGTYVTLIDTPGFDDTERTDADILGDIARWLESTYSYGKLLTGVILLQPISNNRVYGSEMRRTRVFKKICGTDSFRNLVIATTMWSEIQSTHLGNSRVEERQRSNEFWGDMVAYGARVVKHTNTKESAQAIVKMLLDRPQTTLQMQRELSQNDGLLRATAAGQQMDRDLGAMSEKTYRELEQVQLELRSQRKYNSELTAELQSLRQKVADLESQRERLQNERHKSSRTGKIPPWISALGAVAGAAACTLPLFCSVM